LISLLNNFRKFSIHYRFANYSLFQQNAIICSRLNFWCIKFIITTTIWHETYIRDFKFQKENCRLNFEMAIRFVTISLICFVFLSTLLIGFDFIFSDSTLLTCVQFLLDQDIIIFVYILVFWQNLIPKSTFIKWEYIKFFSSIYTFSGCICKMFFFLLLLRRFLVMNTHCIYSCLI
jgi:hypothetical protein